MLSCTLFVSASAVRVVLYRDGVAVDERTEALVASDSLAVRLRAMASALGLSLRIPTTLVVDQSVAVVRPIAGLSGLADPSIVAAAVDVSRGRYFLDSGLDLRLSQPVRLPDGSWSIATFDATRLDTLDEVIGSAGFKLLRVVPAQPQESFGADIDERYAVVAPNVLRNRARLLRLSERVLLAICAVALCWACAAPSVYFLWLSRSVPSQQSPVVSSDHQRADLTRRHEDLSALLAVTNSRAAAPIGPLATLAALVGALPDSAVLLSASLNDQRGRLTLLANNASEVLDLMQQGHSGVRLALAGPISRELHQGATYDRLVLSWTSSVKQQPRRRDSE
jgi:hypothetical protein